MSHDNIIDYFVSAGYDENEVCINRRAFEHGSYDDVCSNLFIQLQEDEKSEWCDGIYCSCNYEEDALDEDITLNYNHL